jgi:hypothetical protein
VVGTADAHRYLLARNADFAARCIGELVLQSSVAQGVVNTAAREVGSSAECPERGVASSFGLQGGVSSH